MDAVWKAAHEKNPNPSDFGEVQPQSDSEHKTLEVPLPEQPHSAYNGGPHPKSSSELGAGFEASNFPFHHGTRAPNSKDDFERTKNDRLDMPAPSDNKKWTELETILSDILPKRFTNAWIHSTPSNKLATDFDDFLYDFFKENCGLVEAPKTTPPNSGNKHKGLEKLRRQKQICKKALKHLRGRGFTEESTPISSLKDVWRKLLKAHNKLRRAVKHKQRARAKKFAKRQFIKDRIKFTKKLFSDQRKSGNPTFNKQQGEEYFSKLYHDEDRSADFTPLEGMARPLRRITPSKFDPRLCVNFKLLCKGNVTAPPLA